MTSNVGKVLVGGGTGYIGRTLTKMLQHKGYDVTIISRTSGKAKMTWDDIKKSGIPDNTVAVVNLAGQNVLDPMKSWTDQFKKIVVESRVKTTSLLAKAIDSAAKKPKVFVCMSGVGIYKPDEKIIYDEHSDVSQSYDFISRLAHDWEDASKTSKDVRRVNVRSGVVLGRGGGMISQIYAQFFFSVGGPMGSGNQPFPWIHLHDLSRLILFSIENQQVSGAINGVAPQLITNKEFTRAFAKSLMRFAIFRTPSFAIRKLFGEERAVMILEGQWVQPNKVINEYKFQYLYPTIDLACSEFKNFMYKPPPIESICR